MGVAHDRRWHYRVGVGVPPAGGGEGSRLTTDTRRLAMNDLERMRHSAAHVMAEAVLDLFPEAKLGIGPPIEDGFYYDFDLPRSLTPDDLGTIEGLMRERVATASSFEYRVISEDEARAMFKDQPYKLDLIDEIAERGEELSIYHHGDFT